MPPSSWSKTSSGTWPRRRRSGARGPAPCIACARRAASAARWAPMSIAAAEVSQSIFFAAAIIIAGFVPLFTLSGIEGHIFGPMAKTYAYAIAGGLIATFTIAPALEPAPVPERRRGEGDARRSRAAAHLRAGARIRARQPHHHLQRRRRCSACWRSSRCARWASSSCRSSRKATCGSARRFRSPSRWRTATATSIACAADERLSGGPDRGVAARPARRRHRCHRLLQCRVLRAAEALRHLAARRRQGKADRGHDRTP